MKIYIGADHNGYDRKAELSAYLQKAGYEVVDEGDNRLRPEDDFPQFASKVVLGMRGDEDPTQARGILICGSGQGMCMAANRYKGIRATLAYDQEEARTARNDDDSNILCLSGRTMDLNSSIGVIHTWLMTPFAGANRFKRRIRELDEIGD